MKYNISNEFEYDKAIKYMDRLKKKACVIELREIKPIRSLPQNAYFYKILSIYALEFGWSLEEAKRVIKIAVGLYYEKNGHKFLKSTADLDTAEMTKFIDDFRKLSLEQDCYLPTPEEWSNEHENFLEENKTYL